MWSSACASLVLAGLATPAVAGTITFSGDPALTGALMTITTPDQLAAGTSTTETFCAAVAGILRQYVQE